MKAKSIAGFAVAGIVCFYILINILSSFQRFIDSLSSNKKSYKNFYQTEAGLKWPCKTFNEKECRGFKGEDNCIWK
jgi:hypothetical protein